MIVWVTTCCQCNKAPPMPESMMCASCKARQPPPLRKQKARVLQKSLCRCCGMVGEHAANCKKPELVSLQSAVRAKKRGVPPPLPPEAFEGLRPPPLPRRLNPVPVVQRMDPPPLPPPIRPRLLSNTELDQLSAECGIQPVRSVLARIAPSGLAAAMFFLVAYVYFGASAVRAESIPKKADSIGQAQ